jgi:hypothetical protein
VHNDRRQERAREHCVRALGNHYPGSVVDLLLSERAASFSAGDKSGYSRGYKEGRIDGMLGRLQLSLGQLRADYALLQSKYETLEAAARAVLAWFKTTRRRDAATVFEALDAALTPEPKP